MKLSDIKYLPSAIKTGIVGYFKTIESPAVVFIGTYALIMFVVFPKDIVEKVLSIQGFRLVWIMLCVILIFIGNLKRNSEIRR